jgi:hypothetical protein
MMFNQNILYSAGHGTTALWIDMGRKVVILIGIVILYRFGIKALIAGQVASTLLALVFTQLAVAGKRGIQITSVLLPLFKLILVSGLCFLFSYYFIDPFVKSGWAQLAIKTTLVPVAFLLLVSITGMDTLRDVWKLAVEFISQKKSQ